MLKLPHGLLSCITPGQLISTNSRGPHLDAHYQTQHTDTPNTLTHLCRDSLWNMQEGSYESLTTPRSKSTSSERESSLALLSTAQQVQHADPEMVFCASGPVHAADLIPAWMMMPLHILVNAYACTSCSRQSTFSQCWRRQRLVAS